MIQYTLAFGIAAILALGYLAGPWFYICLYFYYNKQTFIPPHYGTDNERLLLCRTEQPHHIHVVQWLLILSATIYDGSFIYIDRGDMDISNSAVIEEYKRDKLQLLRDGDIEEYGGRMKRAVKAKYKYKTQILMDLIISEAKIDDFDNVYTKILKDAALFNQYGK